MKVREHDAQYKSEPLHLTTFTMDFMIMSVYIGWIGEKRYISIKYGAIKA